MLPLIGVLFLVMGGALTRTAVRRREELAADARKIQPRRRKDADASQPPPPLVYALLARPALEQVSVLLRAAQEGWLEDVRRVVRVFGADVTDREHNTALMWAAQNDHPNVMSFLLESGADPDLCTRRQANANTALICAAWRGHARAVLVLLAAGADPNQGNSIGTTALMWAAHCGHTQCVAVLLAHGARADQRCDRGRTALHCGALSSAPPVLLRMLRNRMNGCSELADRNGQTARQLAVHAHWHAGSQAPTVAPVFDEPFQPLTLKETCVLHLRRSARRIDDDTKRNGGLGNFCCWKSDVRGSEDRRVLQRRRRQASRRAVVVCLAHAHAIPDALDVAAHTRLISCCDSSG